MKKDANFAASSGILKFLITFVLTFLLTFFLVILFWLGFKSWRPSIILGIIVCIGFYIVLMKNNFKNIGEGSQ